MSRPICREEKLAANDDTHHWSKAPEHPPSHTTSASPFGTSSSLRILCSIAEECLTDPMGLRSWLRKWRTTPVRFTSVFLSAATLYFLFSVVSFLNSPSDQVTNVERLQLESGQNVIVSFDDSNKEVPKEPSIQDVKNAKEVKIEPVVVARPNPKFVRPEKKPEPAFSLEIDYNGKKLYVEKLLTHPLAESLKAKVEPDASIFRNTKKLTAPDTGFNNEHLGGCPNWKCEFTRDVVAADVVITSNPHYKRKGSANQLLVYYSQESPRNSVVWGNTGTNINMTLGFRHDSPGASPYGYTVKFAAQSVIPASEPVVDEKVVMGKSKGAAWFVSHCATQSQREKLVAALQEHMEVDIFGTCGTLNCPKNTRCENDIETKYHFYLALENSICEDYITEKLWFQGYSKTAIPIVLKRSIVEPYVPPNSFIAFDDYTSVQKMAEHLKSLMKNKSEYMKYFEWKRNYAVIFLNGLAHNVLERPWGFCQLCRIAHLLDADPKAEIPLLNDPQLTAKWDGSCERDGELAKQLIAGKKGNQGES